MANGIGSLAVKNGGGASNPTPSFFQSVLEQVTAQALQQPDAVAIVSGAERVTYGQIVTCASALASSLEATLDGRRGCPVAVCTENCFHLTVAALAAWQAGCSYLPISPSAPVERLRHMLAESDTPSVIVSGTGGSRIPDGNWKLLQIDKFTETRQAVSERPLVHAGQAEFSPGDVAYIIYTSGSTGTPKGVAVTHGNLSNLISWYNSAFAVTQKDRVTQMRALTFDVSVAELWPALCAGATVHALDRARYLLPERLRDYLVAQEITICEAPTLLVEQLVMLEWPAETKLRFLQTGGESLRVFPRPGVPFQLVNNYGPTECTVISTSGLVAAPTEQEAHPSIGRPIAGAEVFVLDSGLQPVPDGQQGEIFIAGAGVAAGYVGRPDLTEERFLAIPGIGGGSRAYRTGDIGRRLPNGEFEFCGRIDDQIKLRGYRIEPGEIMAALRNHPLVTAGAVTTVGEGAEKQLVAYIVLQADVSGAELRDHLALHVPGYMIPELFVPLEAMPLTAHGKIDYSALPFPDRSLLLEATDSTLEPTTKIEIEIAAILSRILKQPKIGLRDNFFRLGGNSLLAAQVVINVQHSLGVELPMRSIFEAPTIEGLAQQVEQQIAEASPSSSADGPIPRRANAVSVEVSEEQHRIWLHAALAGRTDLYNEPFTLQYTGDLNVPLFERSLNEIVRRHEAWRTSFEVKGDQVFQKVNAEHRVNLPFDDLRTLPAKQREQRVSELLTHDAKLEFDLDEAPLIRLHLVRVADRDFRLLVVAHHLVADGVSIYQIFVSELHACYLAFLEGREPSLPVLPFQYPDYVEWQRRHLADRNLEIDLRFWEQELGRGLPVLNLPLDRPRGQIREPDGGSECFRISREITLALKNVGESCHATMFMTLLAAFHVLLYRCTGDGDQVVGSATSTRKQFGTENLLGLFINTVVLRNRLAPQDSFLDLVRRVRETTLEVLAHDVPFEILARRFGTDDVPCITPLFQVMFVFEPSTALPSPEWHILQTDLEQTLSKTDLYVQTEENGDELLGRFSYCRDIFDSRSIIRMKQLWNEVLSNIASNPNRSIEDIANSLEKPEASRKSPLNWLRERMRRSA